MAAAGRWGFGTHSGAVFAAFGGDGLAANGGAKAAQTTCAYLAIRVGFSCLRLGQDRPSCHPLVVSATDLELPSDPDELRACVEEMKERLAASEQALADERKAHDATRDELDAARNAIKLTTLQIEKLKAQLAKLRRMKFGQSSERMTQLADQLELTLEDLEAQQAHAECIVRGHVDQDEAEPGKPRRKPKRELLPDHLPRDVIVHPAPGVDRCSACDGIACVLGKDITEALEYVPASFRVVRHVRPKVACTCCDTIAPAPAPGLSIPRGRAGPGLLAHIIVAKFADHLPRYRPSQTMRARASSYG